MTKHNSYSNINFGSCHRDHYSDYFESNVKIEHAKTEVTVSCAKCDRVIAVFYRILELEKESTKVDKSLIGNMIRAERTIAWVGYAKNPDTVLFTEKQMKSRMASELEKMVHGVNEDSALAAFKVSSNWRLEKAMRQQAKYKMLQAAFDSHPILNDRGFWFRDGHVEGEIVDVATCWTGKRSPASVGASYEDYEPAYLDGIFHSIYCVYTSDHRKVLVYPLDIKVDHGVV